MQLYEQRKDFQLTNEEREEKNFKEKDPEIHYINMTWKGADFDSLKFDASEKQHHYITYGSKEYNASTFKKLTYKNVYKNIDIVYSIPEDKEFGIEYSVIAYPGADLSQFKILYSGDFEKMKLKDGKVIIKTALENITEHAPLSFYENNEVVKSEFELKDNLISFKFFPNSKDFKEITPFTSCISKFN